MMCLIFPGLIVHEIVLYTNMSFLSTKSVASKRHIVTRFPPLTKKNKASASKYEKNAPACFWLLCYDVIF